MRVLCILAAAAEEAVEAVAWYERERPGLGLEFEAAIEAALDLIELETVALSPAPRSAGTRGVKRLMLRRFPYAIIVREHPSEIVVIAFAHHARRPGYWRGRSST